MGQCFNSSLTVYTVLHILAWVSHLQGDSHTHTHTHTHGVCISTKVQHCSVHSVIHRF